MHVRYSQTPCSHLSLADCCTQTVDHYPLLVFHYSFLATSSLSCCSLIFVLRCPHYHSYLLVTHAFFLNAHSTVPLKRSAVFHSHIDFQCSVPVSRCSLLAAQFFCLVACCSPFFPFLLFGVCYSLLYTRGWPRTDYLCFVSR